MELIARLTQPDFLRLSASKQKPQLITIPYSHYNEFARWSWNLRGLEFDEHAYPPGAHILPVLSLRKRSNVEYISTSSCTQTVGGSQEEGETTRRRRTAVPVMALPNGVVLRDSWEIAKASGLLQTLSQEDVNFYDYQVAPAIRQYSYAVMLKLKNRKIWDKFCTMECSKCWCFLWYYLGVGMIITKLLIDIFKPCNTEAYKQCRQRIVELFEVMDTKIERKKGKYLHGNDFSTEDIALSCFIAPMIRPAEFALGKYKNLYSELEDNDRELQDDLRFFRNTKAGAYALKMFHEHRTTILI